MVFMPPGSAKSTYTSHLFPGWYFNRHPGHSVIGASHKSTLAQEVSGKVKGYIKDMELDIGYGLETDALEKWKTTNGGSYLATGAGAGIAGFRSDLFLIDDPFGDRAQAESHVERDKIWGWFRSDVRTRMRPGGRIVIIQTRWHEDDLSGRLLETQADGWTILKLPAIAGEGDPLGREPGEWLWDGDAGYAYADEARSFLKENGEGRDWWSLYQQEPKPADGGLFKVNKIEVIEDTSIMGREVRAWDLAATAQVGTRNPDWTVGLRLMRTAAGRYIVRDIERFRGGPDEVEARILSTAQQDGRAVQISLPQDPGQAGKQQVMHLTRMLSGFNVHSSPESGDKATRAAPVASQCNVGNLSIMRSLKWNQTFLDELAMFPSGAKKDQVDALSRAFSQLSGRQNVPIQNINLNIMGR